MKSFKLAIPVMIFLLLAMLTLASTTSENDTTLDYRVDQGTSLYYINDSGTSFISQARSSSMPATLIQSDIILDLTPTSPQPNITETNNIWNYNALTSEIVWRAVSVVFNNSFAKVTFQSLIDLSKQDEFNLDQNVNLSFNRVELNSTALPEFNKPVQINITGLSFERVRILKDGSECTDCSLVSYNDGDAVFNAPGFSVYSIGEGNYTSAIRVSTRVLVKTATFNVTGSQYQSSYPENVTINLGGGNITFNHTGTLNAEEAVADFADVMNYIIDKNCTCSLCELNNSNLTCTIGMEILSDSAGAVVLSDLNITQDIKNVTIYMNNNYTMIDLDDYFYDQDHDTLAYNVTPTINLTININHTTGIATVIPDYNWYGNETLKFNATDSTNVTYSNNVTIFVRNESVCGNNILEFGESCDGTDFGGLSCSDFSFNAGSLVCTASCTIDTTGCYATTTTTSGGPGNSCYGVTCPDSSIDCDDGSTRTCSNTCSDGDCSTCTPPSCCQGITCDPTEITCDDGTTRTCQNTCSGGVCSECIPPSCPGPCEGITCNPSTRYCADGSVKTCQNTCIGGYCTDCEPAQCPTEEEPNLLEDNLDLIPCINVTRFDKIEPVTVTETTPEGIMIPQGFEIAVPPFQVSCGSQALSLTLSVPANFVDLQVLKCIENICVPANISTVNELWCEKDHFGTWETGKSYFDPHVGELIEEKSLTLSELRKVLKSGNTSVQFVGDALDNTTAILSPIKRRLQQPENVNFRIIGSPIVIKLDKSVDDFSTIVSVPYPDSENYNENSISMYIMQDGMWDVIDNVEVDTENNIITARIEDTQKYLNEDLEIEIALIGSICINCIKADLVKVYEPKYGSREAVILVHGLASSPRTYNKIIADIEKTNQPFQVWVFGYPSDRTIAEISSDFTELIESKSDQFDTVHIVSHSLGGLIVQKSLHDSFTSNRQGLTKYDFVSKVDKVILVGVPNKGTPAVDLYRNLFKNIVNLDDDFAFIDPDSPVLDELVHGMIIPRIPTARYYVIAGTQPYKFKLLLWEVTSARFFDMANDGIVDIDSAQHVGDFKIDDKCSNYWELNLSHTDLIDEPLARQVIESILGQDIAQEGVALLGNQKYYNLNLDACVTGETYVVIGKKIEIEKALDETGCACGNGYCGVGETPLNCPTDCARIVTTENICNYAMIPIFAVMIVLMGISALYLYRIYKVTKRYSPFWNAILSTMTFVTLLVSLQYLGTCKNRLWYIFLAGLLIIIALLILPLIRKPRLKAKGRLSLKEIDMLEQNQNQNLTKLDKGIKESDSMIHKIDLSLRKFVKKIPLISLLFRRKPKQIDIVKKKEPVRKRAWRDIDEELARQDRIISESDSSISSEDKHLKAIDKGLKRKPVVKRIVDYHKKVIGSIRHHMKETLRKRKKPPIAKTPEPISSIDKNLQSQDRRLEKTDSRISRRHTALAAIASRINNALKPLKRKPRLPVKQKPLLKIKEPKKPEISKPKKPSKHKPSKTKSWFSYLFRRQKDRYKTTDDSLKKLDTKLKRSETKTLSEDKKIHSLDKKIRNRSLLAGLFRSKRTKKHIEKPAKKPLMPGSKPKLPKIKRAKHTSRPAPILKVQKKIHKPRRPLFRLSRLFPKKSRKLIQEQQQIDKANQRLKEMNRKLKGLK